MNAKLFLLLCVSECHRTHCKVIVSNHIIVMFLLKLSRKVLDYVAIAFFKKEEDCIL